MIKIIALIVGLFLTAIPVRETKTVVTKMPETETTVGKFTSEFTDNGKQYYQFKSHDDTVWWVLSESEIGFEPSMNKEYILSYCNNGTTKENKPCDCIPEWDCECEVYDDVFIEIYEEERK